MPIKCSSVKLVSVKTRVHTHVLLQVPSVKTVTVFKDPNEQYQRSASYVQWHPDGTIPKVSRKLKARFGKN